MKWIGYLRKSLDEEGRQVVSIDYQKKEILSRAKQRNAFLDRQIENLERSLKEISNESEKRKIKREIRNLKNMKIEKIHFLKPDKKSGLSSKRPYFNKMIELLEKGEFDGIAAYSLDRLSRNPEDYGKIWNLLRGINEDRASTGKGPIYLFIANLPDVDWHSYTGYVLFLSYILTSAIEVLGTQMRTTDAMEYLRSQGKHVGSIPFGYVKRWDKGKEYTIEINEEEAKVVREAFRLAAEEGWGRRRIANSLNVSDSLIRSILNNERYTGYMVVEDNIVESELPAIISIEDFCKIHPGHVLCRKKGENFKKATG